MMSLRSKKERRIFFPWEGRGAIRRFLVRERFVSLLVMVIFALFVSGVVARERSDVGIRRSRVALSIVRPLVERYLLDFEGKCPSSLDEVRKNSELAQLPRDGWGRQLRLVCGVETAPAGYVLMSDGADGLPGGLDRIEY